MTRELDELMEDIKAKVRKSPFKLFKLEVGDLDCRQEFVNHQSWREYVKNNKNPSNFTTVEVQSSDIQWNEYEEEREL